MVRLSAVLGFALAVASVLIPGVLSQDIPACAQTCAGVASTSSGCALTDTNCLCNSSAFATAAGSCIAVQCTASEIQTAQQFFLDLCSGTGTTSSTPSSGTSTPTDSSTPTDTSSVVPSTTSSTAPSTTTTSTPATSIPRTTTTTSPASTRSPASVVSSTTTTSPSSTPSNHATHDQPAGVLGAGLALALALFAW